MENSIPVERIEKRVFLLRGHKVMLSTDLAELYGVEPRALVQAVKWNIERFPEDFMFQLTTEEFRVLRAQTVILETGRGRYPKFPPLAFTEQGVTPYLSTRADKEPHPLCLANQGIAVYWELLP